MPLAAHLVLSLFANSGAFVMNIIGFLTGLPCASVGMDVEPMSVPADAREGECVRVRVRVRVRWAQCRCG